MIVTVGAVNVSSYFHLRLAADGTDATGLTITNFDLQYVRSGEAPAAKVDATALAATNSAHGDNQAIEIDATDQPGVYRVDWPDAAFATGVPEVILTVKCATAFTESLRVQLISATRGLAGTALPNADADAAGGLPISDAGGLDLDARLDAAISSRLASASISLSAGAVTVGTNNDKTGYGLVDGAITAAKIASDAITSAKVADGFLTAAKFASGAFDAVWSVATRILTAGTNIVLAKGTGVTGFNDLSAAQVNAEADTALSDAGVTTTRTGYLDNLSAGAVATASALSTVATNVSTLLTRIPAALFSGITSLAQWLGLIAGKQTGDSTARTELRATGAGSGTYDETTDSTQALRDRGDAAWTTATGFSTHSAADAATAVWAAGTRTLTSFGTLVADVATAVWSAVTRTVTAATNITSTGGTTVPQTGDAYARLGAPAGASHAADVAAVKADSAAVKAKTDSLTFTGAGRVDANVAAVNNSTTGVDKLSAHLPAVLKVVIGTGSTTTSIVLNATTGIDGGAPSSTNDFYNGRVLIFTSGALAGQATSVSDYDGGTVTLTVVALTGAPASGVTAVLV
jgi:hypothetical protein